MPAGEVRADVAAAEFLTLVFGVTCAHEQVPKTTVDRLLALLFDGLRTR